MYGESSFEFLILEECSLEVVKEREDYWIVNSDCYNLVTNSPRLGAKATKDTIKKLQDSHAQHWIVITPSGDKVKVVNLNQYCKDNNLGQKYMYAAAKTGKLYKGYQVIKV